MGVTIHYVIGMQSGNVKRALDRTQALATDMNGDSPQTTRRLAQLEKDLEAATAQLSQLNA